MHIIGPPNTFITNLRPFQQSNKSQKGERGTFKVKYSTKPQNISKVEREKKQSSYWEKKYMFKNGFRVSTKEALSK